MNEARTLPRMVLLRDGTVMVVGGLGKKNAPVPVIEIYDPANDRWAVQQHAPDTVNGSPAALPDGRILFVGKRAWIYKPLHGGWTELSVPPDRESGFSVTVLSDGRVLVLGGGTSTGRTSPPRLTASALLFDPATNVWNSAPALRAPRWLHEAVELPDGRVLVIGGIGIDSDLPEIEIYSVPSL